MCWVPWSAVIKLTEQRSLFLHPLPTSAPDHCTGEPAFTALMQSFGDHYLYDGLGTVIALGPQAVPPC